MDERCNHRWVSNSGRGGVPDFRVNRQLALEPIMHIACEKCHARTWMTQSQWYDMRSLSAGERTGG